jgi:chemotaxis protein histidine kinase CheA
MSAISDSLKSGNKPWIPMAVLGGVVVLAAALATPTLHHARFEVLSPTAAASHSSPEHLYANAHSESFVTDSAPAALPTVGMIAGELQRAAPAASPKAPSATADRKIVRTGSLELTVKSPADSAEQIRRMAESMGGYLEAAQIGGTKEAPTADITIRVPAPHFEEAKAQIRKLAARVETEKTNAEDVTRQYVDMEARLRNLRAEEAQYLTIMKSAYKVDDLLEVTQKLSEVRGQIEQQQAEFQTLSKQVETVAITISLHVLADAQVFGLNWRPLYQLKVAARDGLDALADYATTMVASLFYAPVILAWSLTILLTAVAGWRLLRWTGRRFFTWAGAAAPQKVANSI